MGLSEDIKKLRQRDPAARGVISILLCYPGLHAIWCYRVANLLWSLKLTLPALFLSYLCRCWTGIEIHPGATIGKRFFIDHGCGVVIGETAEIGDDCMLYHNVTLGGSTLNKGKRHPTLEDNVMIGAGAKILGAITLRKGSRVGANSVVTRDVPEEAVVVGIPGKIIRQKGKSVDEDQQPDIVGELLADLQQRISDLEKNSGVSTQNLYQYSDEAWTEQDFSI